jgi:hypothetical protein
MGLHSNGRLLSLPANIREGCKCLALTNTPAYCNTATIMAAKSFIVKGPAVNF